MASQATITDRTINQNGPVYFKFSDGTEMEFPSLQALNERLAEVDSDAGYTRLLAIAYFKARSSDFSNLNLVKDKAVVYDLSNNNPVRLDPNASGTGILSQAR